MVGGRWVPATYHLQLVWESASRATGRHEGQDHSRTGQRQRRERLHIQQRSSEKASSRRSPYSTSRNQVGPARHVKLEFNLRTDELTHLNFTGFNPQMRTDAQRFSRSSNSSQFRPAPILTSPVPSAERRVKFGRAADFPDSGGRRGRKAPMATAVKYMCTARQILRIGIRLH